MIAIIDLGLGNLFSLSNALDKITSTNIKIIDNSYLFKNFEEEISHLILPGVGSFPAAMKKIKENNWHYELCKFKSKKKPILGICLGMQLLFEKSFENNIETEGLNFIEGDVKKLVISNYEKIPHTGWNNLIEVKNDIILKNVNLNADFYFTHSFYCNVRNKNEIIAFTDYGNKFPSLIKKDNIYGCQFHPEKSSDNGIKILKNFFSLN